MIRIRYTRIRRYKKQYKRLLFLIHILTIWSLFLLTILQLNSFTNASFNDVEELSASLHVKWPFDEDNQNPWDKSSLAFSTSGLKRGATCSPPYIYAEIYNSGADMTFSIWSWELFKVGKGKASKTPQGPALDSGIVEKIKSDNKGRIDSSSTQLTDGNYRFKVTKPDRPGQDHIWSEVIEIKNCSGNQVNKDMEQTVEKKELMEPDKQNQQPKKNHDESMEEESEVINSEINQEEEIESEIIQEQQEEIRNEIFNEQQIKAD
ncbi:amyloid fiber anchoring/assembly protein TapA [Pseudoneobacillus sp. C159]